VAPGSRRRWLLAALGFALVVAWLALGVVGTLVTQSALLTAVWMPTAFGPLALAARWLVGPVDVFRVLWVGAVPLLLAGICASVAVPELVLAGRGEPVAAVITAAERNTTGRGGVFYDYTLRTLDGHAIAGRLEIDDERPVGYRVDVVVDPGGVAAPDLVGSVTTKAGWLTALAGVGLVGLAVVIGWAAAGAPTVGSPRSGRRGSRRRR
jgi:hypothetical protein